MGGGGDDDGEEEEEVPGWCVEEMVYGSRACLVPYIGG